MDRFIDDFLVRRKLKLYNLKSNMDRFIVYPLFNITDKATYLKSNMDRFIDTNHNRHNSYTDI